MDTPIKFVNDTQRDASLAIAETVQRAIEENKSVLWLVSGGSNIQLESQIMKWLKEHLVTKLQLLTIIPMDERYGPFGHKDSNTQALRDNGFDAGNATWVDVLEGNAPLEETVDRYSARLKRLLNDNEIIIGQFGMGADGHTAGIKPGSPATKPTEDTVIGYTWSDFTRLTMTKNALMRVTNSYVLAYGHDKKAAIDDVRENTKTFDSLPSILFHQLPSVTIYSDQI